MPYKENVVTRRELYDRVWSKAMRKIAPELGISDVRLRKICHNHKVPTPPFGYWAKIAARKKVPRQTKLKGDEAQIVRFRRTSRKTVNPAPPKAVPNIKTDVRLKRPHRLVKLTQSTLRTTPISYCGALTVQDQDCLAIYVSKSSLKRALVIMDAVLKYWESTGGTVTVGAMKTSLHRDGHELSIVIKERMLRQRISPEPMWGASCSYTPTGELVFRFRDYGAGLRKKWADGKEQRLEDVLGSLALGIEAWVSHVPEPDLNRICRERQKKRADAVKAIQKKRGEEEESRQRNFKARAEAWKTAQRLREYLAAVDESVETGKDDSSPECDPEWREWAEWYVSKICPLTTTLPTPEIHKPLPVSNTRISDLDLTCDARAAFEHAGIIDTNDLAALSREQLLARCETDDYSLCSEAADVLTGLGYT